MGVEGKVRTNPLACMFLLTNLLINCMGNGDGPYGDEPPIRVRHNASGYLVQIHTRTTGLGDEVPRIHLGGRF